LLFIDGTYPLLPWLAFFLLGAIIHDVEQSEEKRVLTILLVMGAGISGAALSVALYADRTWALTHGDAVLTFFPANSAFMVTASFAVLAAVQLLGRLDPESFSAPFKMSFARIGQISLTIYLLHFIPLRIIDVLDLEPSNTAVAMGVVLGYTLLWWPLSMLHHRYAKWFSIEALLRRLSSPTSKDE